MSYTVANTFANQSGNVAASQLDGNFTSVLAGVNNAFLVGTFAARPAPDGVGNGRYYFATDQNGGTLYRDNGSSWVAVAPGVAQTIVWSEELSGLTLSNDSGSPNTTLDIAVGLAASDDAVLANRIGMSLTSAFTKTTGAWAVGSGNGALDTGSVAASSFYHVFLIERTDTSVVDILFSLSATAPTMPANYTKRRRIGTFQTDGASHILAFTQVGDYFYWGLPITNVNATNPGTAAVLVAVSVPTGVSVIAILNVVCNWVTSTNSTIYFSSPNQTDTGPGATTGTLVGTGAPGASNFAAGQVQVGTNTVQQIRYRLSLSGASDVVTINCIGYIDRRGRG